MAKTVKTIKKALRGGLQQSSATPSRYWGLQKIVVCSKSSSKCIINSFWHSVIPTSNFIFNDVYIEPDYKFHRTRTGREYSIVISEVGCRDGTVPKTINTIKASR